MTQTGPREVGAQSRRLPLVPLAGYSSHMGHTVQDGFDDDSWNGGYYETAMVLGPNNGPSADQRLRTAIAELWSSPSLTVAALGDRARWQAIDSPSFATAPLDDLLRIYGTFADSTLGLVPFTSVVVREENPDGEDWLYACVPLGGIPCSGGYPFGDLEESRSWREPLEGSLANLTLRVCEAVPLRLAAIGFEIAGIISVQADAIPSTTQRPIGYVTKYAGKYRYWPTTAWT